MATWIISLISVKSNELPCLSASLIVPNYIIRPFSIAVTRQLIVLFPTPPLGLAKDRILPLFSVIFPP